MNRGDREAGREGGRERVEWEGSFVLALPLDSRTEGPSFAIHRPPFGPRIHHLTVYTRTQQGFCFLLFVSIRMHV